MAVSRVQTNEFKRDTIAGVSGVDARDPTDTTFVVVRGADPAATTGNVNADNDLITKHFIDRRFSRLFLLMGA